MTAFVLDNSVSMRWLLASEKSLDQRYAERVLKSLAEAGAVVPNLWHLEAANVLLGALSRKTLEVADVDRFTTQLESLPITTDTSTARQAFGHTMSLAKAYRLSSYDAAYLELAVRKGLPLATLDKAMRKAAKQSNVDIYLM
ncbi:PIN domain-containing protein [Seongchinamella sediminis]|uniref:PIN domain-containing protein n=1 Tax=Seongchinamella sediminis TaxID=2283635 RepID=A0A3L7DYL9_9GAMM|nr:type II toxin-antitoxin system VapC family toxin [Seongchinamella sediminis]RLQ21213.1 PIN domain-containing protein [Seongchinamella sediminis]